MFSLCISWALWARAALDSMLGGYIENLAITGVREEWFNKNDKRSATNCPQVGLSSWLQIESHTDILLGRDTGCSQGAIVLSTISSEKYHPSHKFRCFLKILMEQHLCFT